jgi:sigma-E factor negative regulatory protein RseA
MKEQISALMDDELDLDDSAHLFTAVKKDDELETCWATYHLIGDAMRGNPMMKPGFKQQLMARIANEPAVLAPRNIKQTRKPAVWSIAASVAAVTFVGWMVLQQQGTATSESPIEIAQHIPSEYLHAHQAVVPSNSAYFIQPVTYAENGR